MLSNLVVFCTCGSEAEAEAIATDLVAQRLAACVNITSPVRSIYRWQSKVDSAVEWMLIIKTTQAAFVDLSAAIQALHSYEVPEIIALPVTAGSDAYLRWLDDSIDAGN
jgi:periplasmic divalent cation tolerance protein